MKAKGMVAAAFFAVPAFLAVSPIAAASHGVGSCGYDDTCLYGNNGHKWLIEEEFEGQTFWSHIDHAQGNDEMDSWRNKSEDYDSCAAQHGGGGGDRQTLRAGYEDDNVAPWNSDEVSSLRTAGPCG